MAKLNYSLRSSGLDLKIVINSSKLRITKSTALWYQCWYSSHAARVTLCKPLLVTQWSN